MAESDPVASGDDVSSVRGRNRPVALPVESVLSDMCGLAMAEQ